ncbi:MAG: carbohydrate ABC transporter permease [Lachnospiraceae bacterium]|jgi:putative aldouronate transport system permease protein|nr:carbohydrate ABC transporter permease [Lachnospiraceae bacterium]
MEERIVVKPRKRKLSSDRLAFATMGYFFVTAFGLLCLFPFVVILMASFTSESGLMRNGYNIFIPVGTFSLEAYKLALRTPIRVFWAYRNTICATAIGTFFAVMMATMTGYVLQRKDFEHRNQFAFFFFFTTIFNGGLVPWYILCVRYLKLRNNFLALILPLMFSVWNMIIAKSYISALPFEITESAKMDGANDLSIYFRLILPLCTPLLATIGLFSALAYWNDWYTSMLFITSDELKSLQYFLQEMINNIQALKQIAARGGAVSFEGTLPQEGMKMAMTVIATGPIIFLYPFVQKYFVKGLTIGAVKG